MFTLCPDAPTSLVAQIVDGFRRLIAEGALKPGAKLPSIRAFAASHGISVFTVVEAYDRLVAQGWISSRAQAGFFVKRRTGDAAASEPARADLRFDARWYLQQIFESRNLALKPGFRAPSAMRRRNPSTIWATSDVGASGQRVNMGYSGVRRGAAPAQGLYVQDNRPAQYTTRAASLYMARLRVPA